MQGKGMHPSEFRRNLSPKELIRQSDIWKPFARRKKHLIGLTVSDSSGSMSAVC